jgi:hypothetical protein
LVSFKYLLDASFAFFLGIFDPEIFSGFSIPTFPEDILPDSLDNLALGFDR